MHVQRERDNRIASENNKATLAKTNLANKRRRWQLERQDAVRSLGSDDQEDPVPEQLSPVDSGLGVDVFARSPRLRNLGSAFRRSLDWSSIPEEEGEARLVHTFSARTKFDSAPCVAVSVSLTDLGDIVLSDGGNKKVKVFDVSGQLKVECCEPQNYSGGLVAPRGVAALESGELVVCDAANGNIKLFTPEGRLLTMFGKNLSKPSAIAVNSRGHIVVVDDHKKDVFLFKSLTDKKIYRPFCEEEGAKSLTQPTSVCLTTADDIVVYDKSTAKLLVCDHTGEEFKEFDLKCLQSVENQKDEANNSPTSSNRAPMISALCTENHNTILVADKVNNRIASVNIKTGELSRDIISSTKRISKPVAMATNDDGLLVVLEENQQSVKVFKYVR